MSFSFGLQSSAMKYVHLTAEPECTTACFCLAVFIIPCLSLHSVIHCAVSTCGFGPLCYYEYVTFYGCLTTSFLRFEELLVSVSTKKCLQISQLSSEISISHKLVSLMLSHDSVYSLPFFLSRWLDFQSLDKGTPKFNLCPLETHCFKTINSSRG